MIRYLKYIVMLLILGLLLVVYKIYTKAPTITLNGQKILVLDYNTEYKEEGVKAILNKKDISSKVKIQGKVDTSKIGTYVLTYTANNGKKSSEVTRTIEVVDNKKPEIKLNGPSELTINLNSTYKDRGAKAIDEYDGDLTNKISLSGQVNTSKIGTYTLNYRVVDNSNNENYITRKVTVKKLTNQKVPVLMYHYFYDKTKGETGKNSNYMEIHDFEEQVKYLKQNNFYFPTYQELFDFVTKKNSLPEKSVIITIDDGQASFFDQALPIINKYEVKATAFIIGKNGNKFKNYLSDNINFESHTFNMHRGGCTGGHGGIFQCISYKNGLEDLKLSIKQLGSSDALAYPYGDINENTKKITKDAGFKVAFTTKYDYVRQGMDPLELPRIRMSKGVSLNAFKKMVG